AGVLLDHAEALQAGHHVAGDGAADAGLPGELQLVDAEAAEGRAEDDRALDFLVDHLPGEGLAQHFGVGAEVEHARRDLGAADLAALAADSIAAPVEAVDEAGLLELRQRTPGGLPARAEDLGERSLEEDRPLLQQPLPDRPVED